MILDETFLILTAGHYREQLGRLGYLQTLRCLFVYLTAILSLCIESKLRKAFHLSQLRIIRGRNG